MTYTTDINVLENGHNFKNIKNKINIYFVDTTGVSRSTVGSIPYLLTVEGLKLSKKYKVLASNDLSNANIKGDVDYINLTVENFMISISKIRSELGYCGTYDVVVMGNSNDCKLIQPWCNGYILLRKEHTPIDDFVDHSIVEVENQEWLIKLRPFVREINLYNVLLNTRHSTYTVPESRTTCYNITLGTYLVGHGRSSAKPSALFDPKLGVKYAKQDALNDAQDNIGSILSFVETVRGNLKPFAERYELFNYADLTYKLTK